MSKRYGWKRDLPSHRESIMTMDKEMKLPASVDLRHNCPPVYDQGDLGSCTGNATAGCLEYGMGREHKNEYVPSRLFIYYNGRQLEGTENSDSGATISDVIKGVVKYGYCPESLWGYSDADVTVTPYPQCYVDAKKDVIGFYGKVSQNLPSLKGALAVDLPVIFGFTVYESFESQETAKTGIVQMPQSGEQVLGGHAVLLVGYLDSTQQWIVRNSWGSQWGLGGYFLMPYEYLTNPNYSSDFWVINKVPNK